ncbi:MAG: hypothetical protein HQL90_14310 [Magnetococcales bacterium]|nr:hypothetical protein [Magnetococcales bacterium]
MTQTKLKKRLSLSVRFARKPRDMEALLAWIAPEEDGYQDSPKQTLVDRVFKLSNEEYDDFASDMLKPRDWINGGGFLHSTNETHIAIAIESEGRQTLYLDPSGHNYGRYVGIAA